MSNNLKFFCLLPLNKPVCDVELAVEMRIFTFPLYSKDSNQYCKITCINTEESMGSIVKCRDI